MHCFCGFTFDTAQSQKCKGVECWCHSKTAVPLSLGFAGDCPVHTEPWERVYSAGEILFLKNLRQGWKSASVVLKKNRATWRTILIHLLCLICSNNCTLVPGMDWFSSLCTDVTRMGRLVQTAALPETHTVPGMETPVPDTPPLLKGKKKLPHAVKDLVACKNCRGSQ